MRKIVVLPAPLGPMTPTMPPARQLEREVVDQHAVAIALAQVVRLDDDSPSRGPLGMAISRFAARPRRFVHSAS